MKIKDRLAEAYGSQKQTGNAETPPVQSQKVSDKNQQAAKVSEKKQHDEQKLSGKDGLIKATETSKNFIKTGLKGTEKAAKFLLLIGQEEAAKVIKHLKPKEIEAITKEIASIDHIETEEANSILLEFGWLAKNNAHLLHGGETIAEQMLASAFGEAKAKELLRKAVPEAVKPFAFLEDFTPEQIQLLLKNESSQVVALILPFLDPKTASQFLTLLAPPLRADIVKRIANMQKTDQEVIRKVEEVLKERLRSIESQTTQEEIDGAAVLATILKHGGANLENDILNELELSHPDITETIKNQLFTLDDLHKLPHREIQKCLRNWNEKDIALLLKGKADAIKDLILSNVSQSKRTIIMEEYDILGAVRKEEVNKKTQEFLNYFKLKIERGELVLEDDDGFVT